jgi:hypothetical protein
MASAFSSGVVVLYLSNQFLVSHPVATRLYCPLPILQALHNVVNLFAHVVGQRFRLVLLDGADRLFFQPLA